MTRWTIDGVKEALAAKKISARELTADFYKRIEARNPELNAWLALSSDRAYAQADRIDALVKAGAPLPPLGGVPTRKRWSSIASHSCPPFRIRDVTAQLTRRQSSVARPRATCMAPATAR